VFKRQSQKNLINPRQTLQLGQDAPLWTNVPNRWTEVRAGIHPPAVKMEVVVGARTTAVGAVEAHDVKVLVFYPNAAGEASFARLGQRLDIEHQGPDGLSLFHAFADLFQEYGNLLMSGLQAFGRTEESFNSQLRCVGLGGLDPFRPSFIFGIIKAIRGMALFFQSGILCVLHLSVALPQ
jgi:hypothetical protein